MFKEVYMSQFDRNFWDREEEEEETPANWEQNDQYFTEENQEESELYDLGESETVEEFLDVEEVSVVDKARIRLEQGRLYEMLIKHNLFDGVDAMPQAVVKVQSEIKEFITERLEILLGMKSEKQKEVHQIIKESQFNELEVQALKMIASKVTKGASETISNVSEKPKNELNAVRNTNASSSGINSIKKTIPSAPQKQQQIPAKKPVKQQVVKRNKEEVVKEERTENLSPEAIAKRDMKYIDSLKKMPLTEANKLVSERHSRPRPNVRIDQETVNRNYAAKMAINEEAQAFTTLLAMAKRK